MVQLSGFLTHDSGTCCQTSQRSLGFQGRVCVLQALKTFVGLPNSSLLRYTATADNLSGAPQDLQHDKLKYQARTWLSPALTMLTMHPQCVCAAPCRN